MSIKEGHPLVEVTSIYYFIFKGKTERVGSANLRIQMMRPFNRSVDLKSCGPYLLANMQMWVQFDRLFLVFSDCQACRKRPIN